MKKCIAILVAVIVLISVVFWVVKNNSTQDTLEVNKELGAEVVPLNSDNKDTSVNIPVSSSSGTETTTNVSGGEIVKDGIYTLSDVEKHNTKTDCWMAINGKVVDVTEFIASGGHPNNQILFGCGKDATDIFEQVRKHSKNEVQALLVKYEIGVLK